MNINKTKQGRRLALLATAVLSCGFGYYAALGFFTSAQTHISDTAVKSLSGLYYVQGRAVDSETGQSRIAAGTITIQERERGWVSRFEVEMGFDREGGTVSAEVVGTGSGQVDGSMLRGSSTQQLITASVPGVSTRFSMIPRNVGAQIESETTAWIGPDGSIAIEFSDWNEDSHPSGAIAFLSGSRVESEATSARLPQLAASAVPQLRP